MYLFFVLLFCPFISGQISLPRLNIDPNGISTSGISSGACMATQFHVAYSGFVSGAGMIAGAPYYCARGSSITAINTCMNFPGNIDVSVLQQQAETYERAGDIDSLSNLRGSKVAIFHGTQDTTVRPGASEKTVDFYAPYVNSGDITVEMGFSANHGFPTIDYGVACALSSSPYILRCNYDGAYFIMNSIYGDLKHASRDSPSKRGTLSEFNQAEFFYISLPSASSMDRVGYVYIPDACQSGALCRLHIVFHGCLMGKGVLDDEFALNAGYNELADANNIVILYPQAIRSLSLPSNPQGCWDWWGYTINKYATKGANQPLAVARMVEKMAGIRLTEGVTNHHL